MRRKTTTASIAALAAAAIITFANGESSDAFAQETVSVAAQQQAALDADIDAPLSDEVVPIFVTEEVVQDIPETAEEDLPQPAPLPAASSLRELVAVTDTSEPLSEQMQCLAGAIYFEARGEPIAGQLAVGQVVANRAAASQFPASYCGVVYQRSQFSFVRGGKMPRIKTGSNAWKRAKALAKIIHEGAWESEAADSLYFHARYVSPSWSRKKTRRAAINQHIFYR